MLTAIIYLHGSGTPEVITLLKSHLPSSGPIQIFQVGRCEFYRQDGIYWHAVYSRANLALSLSMIQARSPELFGSVIAFTAEPDSPTSWLDGRNPITIVHVHKAVSRREKIEKSIDICRVIGADVPTLNAVLSRS